jgi:hypothetical protein
MNPTSNSSSSSSYATAPYPSKAETSQFFSGSKKKGHMRTMTGVTLSADGGDPFRPLVTNYYAKRVEEIRTGKFRPTPRPSFDSAVAHFSEFVKLRLPANLAEFSKHSKQMNVAVIPFMYRCPHPTLTQSDAWNALWDDGGALFAPLMEMMPKGKNCFMPYVLSGSRPTDAVFIAVVVAHFKEPEPQYNYVEVCPV